ncbi:MAG: glucosyltransferase domain-containing protein [Lachnospiraceae bacterium]|nr:glucosyltransferase domain-containing protein [Lachnospiraceae bacterium]
MINKWLEGKISREEIIAFFALELGAICLFFQTIIKGFYCGDGNLCGIIYRPYSDYVVEDIAGRFLVKYNAHVRSLFILGPLCVIMGITFVILGALVLCRILGIKSVLGKVISGLTIILNPFFPDTLTYRFTADSYLLAFLIAVLVAYLFWSKQNWKTGIISVLLLIMTLCLYQAYYFITVSVFVVLFMRDLLKENANEKESTVIKTAIKKLVMAAGICLIALVCYFILVKFLSPSESRLVGGEAELSITGILSGLFKANPGFWNTFIGDAVVNNAWRKRGLINLVLIILTLIQCCITMRKRGKGLFTWLLVTATSLLVLPCALNGIGILNYGYVNPMMLPTMALPYTFMIALWENGFASSESDKKDFFIRKVLEGCFSILLAYTTIVMIVYIGIYQLVQNYYSTKTENLGNRIETALEMKYPEVNSNCYLYIYGGVDSDSQPQPYIISMAGFILRGTNASQVFNENPHGYLAWNKIFEERLGISYRMYSIDDIEEYLQTAEFQELPVYPASDSIHKLRDGCYFVKLKY